MSSQTIRKRLTEYGIPVRPARNAALMEMAADLPAVVLSNLLGIKIRTATKWTTKAGSPRADYAADLARRRGAYTI